MFVASMFVLPFVPFIPTPPITPSSHLGTPVELLVMVVVAADLDFEKEEEYH